MRISSALRVLALSVAVLWSRGAAAQGFAPTKYEKTSLVAAEWTVGFPLASMRDFVDATSFRGVQLEWRAPVLPRLSVGVAGSFDFFSQNFDRATLQFPNAVVSAPLYRRVQFGTLRATAHYYLGAGRLQPYVGVGVGGAFVGTRIGISDQTSTTSSFAAAADPEAGFLVAIGRGLAIHVVGRYQFTTAKFLGVENARWASVGVGLAAY